MSTPERTPQDAPALVSRPWHTWAFVVLVCVACFAVYQHGLGGQFTNWDDNWLITENRHIRGLSWTNIQTMFNPMAPREELGNEYLPVRDLSYAVNYALDGLDSRGYHATNLLLHVFNSLLVMLLAMKLTGRRLAGGLAGLVFAVHPVHVEAVSWLSSRKDLLAAFFLLLSTHLYLAARRPRDGLMASESFVRRVGRDVRLAYGLSLLCFVLALLSKMPAVVLPALLVLIELFFPRGQRAHLTTGARSVSDGFEGKTPGANASGSKVALRRVLPTLPFWAVGGLFTALAMKIGTGLMREPYGDGRVQSTLTAISAIARDAQALFIGWPMQAAVDMPVQTGFSLSVAIGALLLAASVALGFFGWRANRAGATALGLCGLGALWFLAALAPVSNFAVQIGTVFAERYLYIPSIGLAVALAGAAVIAADKLRGPVRYAPVAALVVVCGVWAWLAADAVRPWHNSGTLWARALQIDPENHTAWFNAGREKQDQALVEADDARRKELFDGAMHDYERALLFPARTYRYDQARVEIARASICLQQDFPSDAMKLLGAARDAVEQPWRSRGNPAHADRVADIEAILANYRGLALSALGKHDDAVAAFEEAVSKSKRYVSARLNLAAELGRAALAATAIDEDMLNRAWREVAAYEHDRGHDETAIEQRARLRYAEFNRRLELSGKSGEKDVPADLAPMLAEARCLYGELIELRSHGAMSRRARARTLVEAAEVLARGRAGDTAAEKCFRSALELDPEFVGLRTLLSRLLFERNNAAARVEANKLLAEELQRNPKHKPALEIKAAGLRQAAVDQATALRTRWVPVYAARRQDSNPTWQGLITAFFRDKELAKSADEFSKSLLSVVALLRQSIETDPDNAEGHDLVAGDGLNIAVGMWFTRVPNLRGNAEDLLRMGFNAKPEDGPLAATLAQFYLELAEQVINRPKGDERDLREGLNELLTNMLTLSERARGLLSRKLFNVGQDVEDGRTGVRGEDGEITPLSEMSRRMVAAEFMRAASLLAPDNVAPLDWLKHYYEDEGNLTEALRVFEQLMGSLKERPDLQANINLSLAQLQASLGQQMLRAFRRKIDLGDEEGARPLHDKAVKAYRDCLATTQKVIDDAADPNKINQPVSLRGIAAQRLATLLLGDAEKYYTIALEAYARLPLDFQTEIAEVRLKRSRFIRDPAEKLRELRQLLKDAAIGSDTSRIEQDIRDIERSVARQEADDLRRRGNFEEALARLAPLFNTPTPLLYATRGDIYADMTAAGGAARDENTRKAAQDYVRAYNQPEALLKGAKLYFEDEALIFEKDRNATARQSLDRAERLIGEAIEGLSAQDTGYARAKEQQKQAAELRKQFDKLGTSYYSAAKLQYKDAKLQEALADATQAVDLLGNQPRAFHLLALIRRDLGRSARPADPETAARWFTQAREALETALALDISLPSLRVEMQYDMAELAGIELGEKTSARNWISLARETIKRAPEEIRPGIEKAWLGKLAELESRLGK